MTAHKIALIAFGASLAIAGLQTQASARPVRDLGVKQAEASAQNLARSNSSEEPAPRCEPRARCQVALNPQPLPPGERDPF